MTPTTEDAPAAPAIRQHQHQQQQTRGGSTSSVRGGGSANGRSDPVDQRYTYDFGGVSEVLDHILVTKGLHNPEYQVVHINSEYADQVSDHDPQVVRLKP